MSDQIVDSRALKTMSTAEVATAYAEGRLTALIGGLDIRRGEKLSPAEWVQLLKAMSAEEISAAKDQGLLAPLEEAPPSAAGADQGARGARFASLREELSSLTPDEILDRLDRGALDPLLRGEVE